MTESVKRIIEEPELLLRLSLKDFIEDGYYLGEINKNSIRIFNKDGEYGEYSINYEKNFNVFKYPDYINLEKIFPKDSILINFKKVNSIRCRVFQDGREIKAKIFIKDDLEEYYIDFDVLPNVSINKEIDEKSFEKEILEFFKKQIEDGYSKIF